MLPTEIEYPEFVPDQLLTSDDLNSQFRYLDEQGRLTRTNLVGLGIVCGLELRTRADGTAITLTRGTGVTSQGYLVAFDETEFSRVRPYDAAQELRYDRFVNPDGSKKLDLWEVTRAAAVEGTTPLGFEFLDGAGDEDERKVALAFVELRREEDKNCNPESCDDKGRTIVVELRVLLARKQDVETLGLDAGLGSGYFHSGFAALPALSLPRFGVPASELSSAAALFTVYKSLLTPARLSAFAAALSALWELAKNSFGSNYGTTNPFVAMPNAFSFVNAGSMSTANLIKLQYVYDHFADLLAAYDELRLAGMETVGVCCPDEALFPRHLLLGRALESPHTVPEPLRHGFQAAPTQGKSRDLERLESLFRRLVLMSQGFSVPPVSSPVRITPSKLGAVPLSVKALPWYYAPMVPVPGPFYTWWSYEKTRAGRANRNLGYHAASYAGGLPEVVDPLAYDLEPYDFLRIEGHVGKPVVEALKSIQDQIRQHRLPVAVVALALGDDASGTQLADTSTLITLRAQFEALKAELLCCLKEQAKYWAKLDLDDAFKKPGKARDYGVLQWMQGANLGVLLGTMGKALGVEQAAKPSVKSSSAPALAPAPAPGRGKAAPSSKTEQAGYELSQKSQELLAIVEQEQLGGVGKQLLGYLSRGDVSLHFIPPPAVAVLDPPTLEHWALIVLDQIQELIVALSAEDLLTLDVASVEAHREHLLDALEELAELVDGYLDAQTPLAILKTYLSDSYHDEAEAIARLMPLDNADAHRLVRIFLNASQTTISQLVTQLANTANDVSAQRKLIQQAFNAIDTDGMMVPAEKLVPGERNALLEQLRERLRNLSCLCALEGFGRLRELLAEWLERMRRLNLFADFVDKHPGIQHKAGVPFGGTFVLVYQRPSSNDPGADPAIRNAAAGLAEGTVVADFYLPYLCCSDQPPIQFQVLETPPVPEEATLTLELNESGTLDYSVEDEGFYEFAVSPPGGALSNATSELGVDTPSAGKWLFRPSWTKDKLGNDDELALDFSYTRGSATSPTVSVTVHNAPLVDIDVKEPRDVYDVTDKVTLTSSIQRALPASWKITTPDENTEEVADVAELEGYELKQPGPYAFQLLVKQPETGRTAFSRELRLEAKGAAAKPSLRLAINTKSETNDYSVGDIGSYPFELSPPGGNLQGASPDVGVKKDGEQFVLIPAGAEKRLGSAPVLPVDVSYTHQGGTSDPVRIRIFARPEADVSVEKDTVKLGEVVVWKLQTRNADSFEWTLTSPEGVIKKRGGKEALTQALNESGPWLLVVKATQTATGEAVSAESTVTVLGDPSRREETKTGCGDLPGLVDEFDALDKVDPAGFPGFNREVLQELELRDLMLQVDSLANDPVEKQRKAFREGKWVPRLNESTELIAELLADESSKVSRALLMRLYRIVGNVLLYINCVSESDLTREQITAMTALTKQLTALEKAKLEVSEMEVLIAWKRDVDDALARESGRAGEVKKADYQRLLTKLKKSF